MKKLIITLSLIIISFAGFSQSSDSIIVKNGIPTVVIPAIPKAEIAIDTVAFKQKLQELKRNLKAFREEKAMWQSKIDMAEKRLDAYLKIKQQLGIK